MRPVIYTTIAFLLAMFGIVGVREVASYRSASAERDLLLTRQHLDAYIDQWESGVAKGVQFWLSDLRSTDRLRDREMDLRANEKWFDSFYIWDDGDVMWPAGAVEEDIGSLRADPCLSAATRGAGQVSNIEAARMYASCIGQSPQVSLLAASESAELLLNADQPGLVDRVIRRVGPARLLSLQEAGRFGVSARRLISLRLQHARALYQGGRDDLARELLQSVADAIAGLDGAALEDLLDLYLYPVAHDLRAYGGNLLGGEDDEAWLRAQRRLALYKEVRDRPWTAADAPSLSAGPRLLVDPYGDPPFLLSYARLDALGVFGGIQLDQPQLLESLLQGTPSEFRRFLSIRDPAGRVLAGPGDPLLIETSFTRVLPHLRVGLVEGAITGGDLRTLYAQLLPIAFGLVIGIFALLGLVHTDRQQVALFERQREFMTRVTHELKTPLAGIRLMAENLEMGSYRDEVQREKFARQIVKEAERLGLRVDEVIHAARQPQPERTTAIDGTTLVAELVERWRPLFDQQGATLVGEAPSIPTPMISQPGLLRDALSNLLDNALKYRHADRPSHCVIRLKPERRWVQFEVEDDGMGVPVAMRRAIFERFRRVEGAGRGKAGGHGLGLAFVAEAARMHGGKVECREGIDGGSTFVMRIRRRV